MVNAIGFFVYKNNENFDRTLVGVKVCSKFFVNSYAKIAQLKQNRRSKNNEKTPCSPHWWNNFNARGQPGESGAKCH